ncbi:MAG: ExbD/TolR family protein [Phycisphaerales bacterium]
MILHDSTDDLATGIDLAPIIDMVFLLLIFFLAATTFQQTERELKIALPEASAAAPISAALREIIINVDSTGGVVVSGRSLDDAALSELLRLALDANKGQKVSIRADRAAMYASVAHVLDLCKHAGITEPFLDTIPTR